MAYVPLNKYGWGTMMNDYGFLEDAGRRVGDWGKEIVRGGYGLRGLDGAKGRGRGRDGRGRGGHVRGRGVTKRDLLKMQLEARDIEMDLLPMGMERRKVNQSSWDYKNHTALLTIEFKFHQPVDPLIPSQPQEPPFVMLTHRNSINTPLLALIQSHVKERDNAKKESACPEWIKSLVFPPADDPESFTPPECVMTAQMDPCAIVLSSSQSRKAYYRFDMSQTLGFLLRHTHFVEFPTIELWEEFKGTVVDTQGAITQLSGDGVMKPKRRKLNVKAGKKTISGLVGGYGSDEEEDEETSHNGLSLLGGYVESDEEVPSTTILVDDDLGDEDAEGDTDDEQDGDVDPSVLLEMLQRMQGDGRWAEHTEDDEVDWGDSGDEPE